MKNQIEFHFKGRTSVPIALNTVIAKGEILIIKQMIVPGRALHITIEHTALNTYIDVTRINRFLLLSFDEKKMFMGATALSDSGMGTYSIVTQYKDFVLIKLPTDISIDSLTKYAVK